MSAINPDFEIENGVLRRYRGPGGDVVIPAGVTSIGFGAFDGCTGLRSVLIPAGVTSIGCEAFMDCTNLTTVEIPEGVTLIKSDAFLRCAGLTVMVIPAGVTSINRTVFARCTGLRSVEIPVGVRLIGGGAFYLCENLRALEIPEGVIGIGEGAFEDCISLTEVVIPAGVRVIGDQAFMNCRRLTEITLPVSLQTLGEEVFSGCLSLENIWVDGTEADVQRIRALLPEELRSTVHAELSELRLAWLFSVFASAGWLAEPSSVLGAQGHPSKKAKQASEDQASPTSTPLLATLLSDGVRMSIPPAAVAVDEAASYQVVSEYAGMVALFL